ncbi:MAG TPA: MFS transporter [Thermomicrobiales bacterium]|nr:MFS transporter [Thermomicrobiales bacterium]
MSALSRSIEQRSDGRAKWYALAITCVALFMAILDNLIVNVALPTISDDLKATTSQLQWIMSAYVLVFASIQITAGGLGDRFGRKRFFILGLAVFTSTSAVAAFVPSTSWLIAARALQGIGAAFIMPLSLSIITAAFPPAERGKAIGIWSAISMSGIAIGPIIGGIIIDAWSWHWIFLINVPIGILAIIAAQMILQESQDRTGDAATDIPGTIAVTAAIASLTWGLIEAGERGWGDTWIVTSLVAAAVLLALFVAIELRSENPMVPMRFFASRNFTGANLVAVATSFLISGLAFAMTMYYQNVHGFSAVKTGFTMLPTVVPMMILGAASGALAARLGARTMITAGMLIAAAGIYLLSRVGMDTPFLNLVPALVIFGFGNGLVFAPMMTTLMNSVETERAGVASAVNGAIRETGFAFGIALLGTIMNQTYRSDLQHSAQFTALRDTSDPQMAPIQPVLDVIAKGVNYGGRVIENTSVFPGLPESITEPIRIASSQAFVAGMEQAFIISSSAMVIAGVIGWLLIRNEAPQPVRSPETRMDEGYAPGSSAAD